MKVIYAATLVLLQGNLASAQLLSPNDPIAVEIVTATSVSVSEFGEALSPSTIAFRVSDSQSSLSGKELQKRGTTFISATPNYINNGRVQFSVSKITGRTLDGKIWNLPVTGFLSSDDNVCGILVQREIDMRIFDDWGYFYPTFPPRRFAEIEISRFFRMQKKQLLIPPGTRAIFRLDRQIELPKD